MNDNPFGFALPQFNPDEALLQLKRSLRNLKLNERGNGFELRGKRVLEWAADAKSIHVRMARTLALAPEWEQTTVQSDADQRKLLDTLKQRLARWESHE